MLEPLWASRSIGRAEAVTMGVPAPGRVSEVERRIVRVITVLKTEDEACARLDLHEPPRDQPRRKALLWQAGPLGVPCRVPGGGQAPGCVPQRADSAATPHSISSRRRSRCARSALGVGAPVPVRCVWNCSANPVRRSWLERSQACAWGSSLGWMTTRPGGVQSSARRGPRNLAARIEDRVIGEEALGGAWSRGRWLRRSCPSRSWWPRGAVAGEPPDRSGLGAHRAVERVRLRGERGTRAARRSGSRAGPSG
jgi:hypothetical protein